jgi:hypothetical protein
MLGHQIVAGDHSSVAVAEGNCSVGVLSDQRLIQLAGDHQPLGTPPVRVDTGCLRAIHFAVSETATCASIVLAVTVAVAAVTRPKVNA